MFEDLNGTEKVNNKPSLIGTRIREISVKEYKVNSPSLYKCMQVTPVNTNIFRRSPGVPINESLLYILQLVCLYNIINSDLTDFPL